MGESRGIGAAGVTTSTQKPSQLSLFCKVLLSLLSFHIFATIPLDFLVWATSCHILPHLATTGPLLAGWVSIKWRGLTPHLHHNTVALWERAKELDQQGSEPALRSHLSSHWLFCKVLLPLLSFHNLSHLCYYIIATILLYFLVWETSCHILPRHATTGPLLAGWVSIKWRGLTPHLHHNTVALCERAKELEQQGSEPTLRSHLSSHWLFCKVLLPLLSFHNLSHLCYQFATIPLDFLVWKTSCHILPRHATTGPLLAGWISIKWRGLTPHLHQNAVALWERAEELEQQGSQPAMRSHLSFHSSATFCFLCTSWFGQPPATSCHDMPRLGPCWQGGPL